MVTAVALAGVVLALALVGTLVGAGLAAGVLTGQTHLLAELHESLQLVAGDLVDAAVGAGTDLAGDSILFHAGTKIDADGRLVTSGGRVIAASSYGPTLQQALATSYKAIEALQYEKKYFRRDIGNEFPNS